MARNGLRSTLRSRLSAVAIGVCVVLTGTSVLLVLATSSTTERVAANATALHWTNGAAGTASIVRAANAQAVFFAVDHAAGFASAQALQRAVQEAETALQSFEAVSTQLAALDGGSELKTEMDRFAAAGLGVLDLARAGDAEAALVQNSTTFEERFRSLDSSLSERTGAIRTAIANSEGTAGRIASITQVFITLLIPLAAFTFYRFLIRRQVAERRIEFEARLEAERELSRSKDEFIAGLSHEFRTPLTAIFGFSELLIEQGIVDPEMSIELIGLINSESAELSRMVEDLLMAARLEAGELTIEHMDVQIADEVEAVLAPVRRAGSPVEAHLDPGLVRVDALRFRQILRNLVSNAVKHGGPSVGVFGGIAAGRYHISVVDNGAGVPSSIVERLFERFVHDGREALLTGSVGLGLNIARSLADAMDGHLKYERLDDLTVFTLSVPLGSDAEPVRQRSTSQLVP
jgi:signal transduction histidine kinase